VLKFLLAVLTLGKVTFFKHSNFTILICSRNVYVAEQQTNGFHIPLNDESLNIGLILLLLLSCHTVFEF